MSKLSINQQKTAIHYSIIYLKSAIPEVKSEITKTEGNLKTVLQQRLFELKQDLETFESINADFD